ncbi:MAG: hypothetical protein HY898_23225 [Deltaproteobacteria bacterium]|nr:hypothetical protein [Deltaproteobacteria bacterium]
MAASIRGAMTGVHRLALAGAILTAACSGTSDATTNQHDTDASVAETGSHDEAGLCVPWTCAQLKAECGSAPDGCGGKVSCGNCPSGQACGGGGPNQCGTGACTPKTCAQLGALCGYASDGCGTVIDCGVCAAPDSCGGEGVMNQCGCTPWTCAALGANCGTAPDGCGGVIDCGTCPGGQTCGGEGTNQCGDATCTPKTCAQLGAGCGVVSDMCSKAIGCGECTAPQVCGGQGMPNQCACPIKTCDQLGAACGKVATGCGDDLDCGACPSGTTCGVGGVANQCGSECKPGDPQSKGCGNCGTSKRVCGAGGVWGEWGACEGSGPCSPGAVQDCMCSTQTSTVCCGDQHCGNDCQWGACGLKPGKECDWKAGDHWRCCGTNSWQYCLSSCTWSSACASGCNCGC